MSNRLLTIAWGVPLPATTKMVLLRIVDLANDAGRRVFPSVGRLAHECCTSERTVQRALRDLEAAGLIAVIGNATGGRGKAREYAVDVDRLAGMHQAYEKGDIGDTDTAENGDAGVTLSDPERVTSVQERVTSATEKGDTHVTPPTKNTHQDPPRESPPTVPPSTNGHHAEALFTVEEAPDDLTLAWEAYNATARDLGWPICQRLSDRRRKALRARLKEVGGLSGWEYALAKARASPFCRGEGGGKYAGKTADFDFLTNPTYFTRLMEGSYDDRRKRGLTDARKLELDRQTLAAVGLARN